MTHASGVELELERLASAEPFTRRIAPEKAAALPEPSDPYKAFGFVENEVNRLVLMMGKDGFKIGAVAYHFLQYTYIGRGEMGFDEAGQFFRFLYCDLDPKLVTVYGRNLLRICDQISQRRMPWIREADRNFKPPADMPGDEPVITRIEITDWKPKEMREQEEGGDFD